MVTQPGRAPPALRPARWNPPVPPHRWHAPAPKCRLCRIPHRTLQTGGHPPAAGSVFQHAQCGKVAGGDKDLFQQLLCRNTAGHAPQLGQPGVKSLHLLGERCFIFTLHHLQHCAVQAHAGVLCAGLLLFFLRFLAAGPQTHKVVVCKPEHRPQHGGSKIDVLRRVVDDL